MVHTVHVTQGSAGTRVDVRVVPRASRTSIDGVRDGRLLVRVTAAPVDRAANDAAVLVVARALDLPPTAVRIVSGHTNKNKVIEISLPADEVWRRLEAILIAP
jgi:uncharacterized protein YggU (UPF0235/DUF167 family)